MSFKTPIKDIQDPGEASFQPNRELLNMNFLHFPFLGTIWACLDPDRIPNPDPPTDFGVRSAGTTSRGR